MNAALRIVLPLAVLAVLALGSFAVFSVVDRLSVAERAAERRAVLTRDTELSGNLLPTSQVIYGDYLPMALGIKS